MAAQAADPTLGNREIGEWFGRSEKWVRDIVRWRTSAEDHPTPYAHDTYADRAPKRAARERTFSRRSRPFLAHDRYEG